jgi:transglutaminase superfamily protein
MIGYRIRVSLLLFAALPAVGAERWLEIRMAGQPAGYLREDTVAAERIVTTVESHIVMNRLGSKVEIRAKTRDEEMDGRLVALRADVSSSAQSTLIEGRIERGSLALTISTGGKSYDRSIHLTEPLLGPEQARKLTLERLRAPGDKFSYAVFSAELGVVSAITRTRMSGEAEELRIEETATGLPGAAMLWLDESGRLRRRVQPGPFGEIEIVLTTRERAVAAASGAELPAEAYKRSLVRSNIQLPHSRRIERLRVRILHNQPELGWPEFTTGHQRVIEQSKEAVVLEIQQNSVNSLPTPGAAYLAPNALFQSDDPTIVKIAREVGGTQPDLFKLRDWTSQHVRFDAGIAIAPASEVMRNRAGTCFGYSVLLGALARAAGIPSRLQMGFVYAGGIWGGHAWIEVFQNGEWIPVDAALVSPRRADAARISFYSSSLEEGTIAGVGSLAQLYGNVDIQILAYTVGGETVEVPAGAKPYSVVGNVYENPWLGVKVRKPASYSYTQLDAVWPQPGIVVVGGPRGEIVTLDRIAGVADRYLERQGIQGPPQNVRIGRRAGFQIVSGSKAALVVPVDGESWVIVVETSSPGDLLRRVTKWLDLGDS